VTDHPRPLTSQFHHDGNGVVRLSAGQAALGRARVPAPLISRRLPSGRGAIEQPDVTGDGEAELTPKFWLMVGLTGVAAGVFGDLMRSPTHSCPATARTWPTTPSSAP
jgi:hypothetical protein